jgi:hypothetical protein
MGPLPRLSTVFLFFSELSEGEIQLWLLSNAGESFSNSLGGILVLLSLWPLVAGTARWLRRKQPRLPRWVGTLLLSLPAMVLTWREFAVLAQSLDFWSQHFPVSGGLTGLVLQIQILILAAGFFPNWLAAWLFLGPAGPPQARLTGAGPHIARAEICEK